jgi:hypothetical protein
MKFFLFPLLLLTAFQTPVLSVKMGKRVPKTAAVFSDPLLNSQILTS